MQLLDDRQIELFDENRWPRKPYCTNDLAEGLRIRSLKAALTHAYVQANPPHLRVWSIYDVDRPGAVLAWDDAGLPPPSWAARNKQNGHAHLVYGLTAPVLVDGLGARDAPMRFLCAVESLITSKLEADVGYSGLITKNPTHPRWETLRGPRMGYGLDELGEYLPGLEKHTPKGKKVEQVGLGRNVTLFDKLRKWAYGQVRKYKGGGLDGWNEWISVTNTRALVLNADFVNPLDGREVWHIAKSVGKWTYRSFDVDASDARFSALQGHRGKQGMLSRWGNNEDKQASARLMRASGLSLRAIADELEVSPSTIKAWTDTP